VIPRRHVGDQVKHNMTTHNTITHILEAINSASGTNEKLNILNSNKDNQLLKKILEFTYDPHKNFGITSKTFKLDKKLINEYAEMLHANDDVMWHSFIDALNTCDRDVLRGSAAIREVNCALSMQISPDMSKWLIRVLDRHLNFGISIKSINSVWSGLVSTFECQLAEKFEPELVADIEYIAIEPKLDGTRIIAIVRGGNTTLYTRNGKIITNFDSTIANELALLCGDRNMVFDGELMSSDFSATMGQLFRKQNNNIKDTFYHVFDVMTYNEWVQRDCKLTCQQSHELLEDLAIDINCKFVKTVERHIIRPSQITEFHKKFREQGYEGSMIKLLDEHYMWKRDTNVMKLKDWYDFDLTIDSFVEGTGRYLGHLGSFVVKYEGKSVKVERGLLTKEQAKEVWENRSHYRGKYIEVQAQEVTKDGSLRFPKFIRFRPDKD